MSGLVVCIFFHQMAVWLGLWHRDNIVFSIKLHTALRELRYTEIRPELHKSLRSIAVNMHIFVKYIKHNYHNSPGANSFKKHFTVHSEPLDFLDFFHLSVS